MRERGQCSGDAVATQCSATTLSRPSVVCQAVSHSANEKHGESSALSSYAVRPHLPPLPRRHERRQRELQHRLAGGTIEHRLSPIPQHADQVAGAGDEAVVPLDPLDRDGGGLAVAEHHQLGQVDRARGAAVDEQDAAVADDLDPVVVGIVERFDLHVRRVGEIEHAVAARGLELEHDRGRRVQVFRWDDLAPVDPGIHPLDLAHQVAGQ